MSKRDQSLSVAARHVVLQLRAAEPNRRIELRHIVQELPDLKPKLWAPSELPLTDRALEEAVGRPVGCGVSDRIA